MSRPAFNGIRQLIRSRRTWYATFAVGCVGALVAWNVTPASASATGYARVGSFCTTVKGMTFCPGSSTLGHTIIGDDLVIKREEASVDDLIGAGTAGNKFCNWRIDWVYADTSGFVYARHSGPMHYTCDATGVGRADGTTRVLSTWGTACAEFYVNGNRRGRQCHSIVK